MWPRLEKNGHQQIVLSGQALLHPIICNSETLEVFLPDDRVKYVQARTIFRFSKHDTIERIFFFLFRFQDVSDIRLLATSVLIYFSLGYDSNGFFCLSRGGLFLRF